MLLIGPTVGNRNLLLYAIDVPDLIRKGNTLFFKLNLFFYLLEKQIFE